MRFWSKWSPSIFAELWTGISKFCSFKGGILGDGFLDLNITR